MSNVLLGLSRFASRRTIFSFAAVLILSFLAFCLFAWRSANTALRAGERLASNTGHIPVRISSVAPKHSSFEPVLTAADFRAAAEFDGQVYVCGKSALFRYQANKPNAIWHAGRELPPYSLSALAVRTGIVRPELWIGTDGAGILVFDGNGFRQILPDALPVRKISSLLPLRNGRMLVGTPGAGLYISDGQTLRLFHPQFAKAQVTALAGDEDPLWIGTRDAGAWRWNGGEALHITQELPDVQVLSIATRGDKAWIGTPVGISEFSGSNLQRHLADGVFAQALAEHDGTLWIGTVDQGLIALPLAVHAPRPQPSDRETATTSIAAFAAINGALTAITAQQLIDVQTNRSITDASATALSSGHISAVHEDSTGRLWIGYFDRGLDVLTPATSTNPHHVENDVLFCINRIRENPRDGAVAVATANGLAFFDHSGTMREVLDAKSGLIASHVTDVLFRADKEDSRSVVIATGAGLSFLDGSGLHSLYAFHGLVNNHVYTIAESGGMLYAGTLGGLSTLRNGLVQASFTTANSELRQNWITASAIFDHQLYLGTYGSGVVRFDDRGEVTPFSSFAGHRIEINANAMLATTRALYAGTAQYGLAILRQGEERWRFITDGLPSPNVTALDEHGGHLYIGTDNGLVSISENNLIP